jgi:dienelactone hydrolase
MIASVPRRTLSASLLGLIALLAIALTVRAADALPTLRQLQTPGGTHYGISSDKPVAPAPTLFIIANPIRAMAEENMRALRSTGDALSRHGWIYVVLDPACEGDDQKPGQPSGLAGWAIRARQGDDFLRPYLRNCGDVLDHLIQEGFTDPQRIAVQGVSRGGFCALHLAAQNVRIKAVIGISPVTNPLALAEFARVTPGEMVDFSLDRQLEKLAGRTVWISIGNTDDRVSTDDCIGFTRRLVATTRKLKPDLKLVPVHLQVRAALGHHAPDDAFSSAADFLRAALP